MDYRLHQQHHRRANSTPNFDYYDDHENKRTAKTRTPSIESKSIAVKDKEILGTTIAIPSLSYARTIVDYHRQNRAHHLPKKRSEGDPPKKNRDAVANQLKHDNGSASNKTTPRRRSAYFHHFKTCPLHTIVLVEFNENVAMPDLILQVASKLSCHIRDPNAWCLVSHGNFLISKISQIYEGGQYKLVSEPLYRLCLAPLNEKKSSKLIEREPQDEQQNDPEERQK